MIRTWDAFPEKIRVVSKTLLTRMVSAREERGTPDNNALAH